VGLATLSGGSSSAKSLKQNSAAVELSAKLTVSTDESEDATQISMAQRETKVDQNLLDSSQKFPISADTTADTIAIKCPRPRGPPPRSISAAAVAVLDPSPVRFSQSTISDTFKWDSSKYLDKMTCVSMEDGGITSVDNRRLLSAKNAKLRSVQVMLASYKSPLTHWEAGRFKFCIVLVINKDLGIVCEINIIPKTFQSAIYSRSGLQSENFSLVGETDPPRVGSRRSTHYCEEGWEYQSDSTGESPEVTWNRIKTAQAILISLESFATPIIHNANMEAYLKRIEYGDFSQLFKIQSVRILSSLFLSACGELIEAGYTDDDLDWMDGLLVARENDIQRERDCLTGFDMMTVAVMPGTRT
jgi:hypothetical protein